MGTGIERREGRRIRIHAPVQLIWRDEAGRQHWEEGQIINMSPAGMALECPQAVVPASCVIVSSTTVGILALSQVRHCVWVRSQYRFGLQLMTQLAERASGPPRLPDPAQDCEELLRLGTSGESVEFEKLFRTLAFRYHPDNQETGNPEAFLQVREIHLILSAAGSQNRKSAREHRVREVHDPGESISAHHTGSQPGLAPFPGRSRRFAVLRLLYEKRIEDCQCAGVPQQEIESITGLPSQEVGFILWYLREKGAVVAGDSRSYAISATGIDLFDAAVN